MREMVSGPFELTGYILNFPKWSSPRGFLSAYFFDFGREHFNAKRGFKKCFIICQKEHIFIAEQSDKVSSVKLQSVSSSIGSPSIYSRKRHQKKLC